LANRTLAGRRDRCGSAPNIVLIVADDLGYNDVSNHGGTDAGRVETPNIDRLAREGVDLTAPIGQPDLCTIARSDHDRPLSDPIRLPFHADGKKFHEDRDAVAALR
jgi:hypothetical protein